MRTVILLIVVGLTTLAAGQELETPSPPAPWDATYGSLLVVHADMPLYPWLALAARQSGTVRVRISIKEGVVVNATAEASAPPVLVQAAKENALTWRFAHDATSTLTVTYVYELTKDESGDVQNPHIEMQLPTLVKIKARPVMPHHMDVK